jgi:hypothetical protein
MPPQALNPDDQQMGANGRRNLSAPAAFCDNDSMRGKDLG